MALFAGGNFTCPNAADLQPGDLNYPSFTVVFNTNAQNVTATYKRTVTNVGTPVSTYVVQVTEPKGVSIVVEPEVMNFQKIGEKLSYTVSFVGTGGSTVSSNFTFGSLVWISQKCSVRSPIAVTWK
ncbi:Subtilisin-like protease SBT1.1 [Forsythia ovata]|uniref:Subtilisin-like protease SBT1.1 n=1 Tax=Forsythia ovata TaxID=205694 RepID=A0ABD1QNG4_9LAMI